MTEITKFFSSDIFSSVAHAIADKTDVKSAASGAILAKKGIFDKFIDSIFNALGYQNISDNEALLMTASIQEASKKITRYQTESGSHFFISKPIIHRERGADTPGIFLLRQDDKETTLLKFDQKQNKFIAICSEPVKIVDLDDDSSMGWEEDEINPGKELNPDALKLSDTDLSNCDFSNLYLAGFDFSNTNLQNSNFSNAILSKANFDGSDLRNTNFQSSLLPWASMKGAHIGLADFSYSNLTGVVLPKEDDDALPAPGVKLHGAIISPQPDITYEIIPDILDKNKTVWQSPYSIQWESTGLKDDQIKALMTKVDLDMDQLSSQDDSFTQYSGSDEELHSFTQYSGLEEELRSLSYY